MTSKHLIVSDLDGTLLDDHKSISMANLEAIDHIRNNSHLFSIATSRYYLSIKHFLRILKIEGPVICSNGSLIYDFNKDSILYLNTIDSNIARLTAEYTINHNYQFLMQSPNLMAVTKGHCRLSFFENLNRKITNPEDHFLPTVIDFTNWHDYSNVFQMAIITDDTKSTELEYQKLLKGMPVNVMASGKDLVVITPIDSSKAKALSFLSAYYGLKDDDVIFFGDNENDESVFKAFKHCVAMGNAIDDIKNIAEFVTLDNNDGAIAYALKNCYQLY